MSEKPKIAFAVLSTVLVVFSLYTAMFGVFPEMIQRGAHISAVIGLVYIRLFGLDGAGGLSWSRIKFFGLGVFGSAVLGYQFFFYEDVVSRFGSITSYEMPIAILAIILLLDATRRTIGWSMVGLAIFFLVYAFYGRYFPGLLAHRGYDMVRILEQVYLGADGIYGTPLGVSSTFVIIIVVLGALLEKTGASGVLMDIAVSMTRNSRGGPAKAAVVGSSLMGMISGTAVANVLTTGTISIPLMRRGGYRPAVAGAVEAVASTGGQLMPPIMGAAAFLMADIMEVPYLDITKAALLPALLFYIAVFASVHLEAIKTGLKPLESIDIPDVAQSLRNSGHVLLSIPVFIGTLISGYSVMYSSLAGIICLLALSLLRHSSRLNPRQLIAAAVSAAEAILPVALATATAGIIIGVVTLTGMGLKFSSFIVSISGNNLLVALILTMASSLVLGMGLPTAAAYILVATLTAPALVSMGVDLMAAHMFVFYSAMLSSITPPVALAEFAAAAICREPPMPPVIKLKSKHKVRILDIPREISAKIRASSAAYTEGDLPANTYADQPKDVMSYRLGNVLLIKSDVPEEIVYQSTKAVMENLDFMATVHPAWKKVSKEGIINGFTIPLHPGALRYYREAGVPGIEEFAKSVGN